MVRLSRRAWNNVLIITTLIMIVIFNSTSNLLTTDEASDSQSITMLPDASVVMTMEFGAIKLERIGAGWRTQPPIGVDEATLSGIVANWQSREMIPESDFTLTNPYVVVVWLAGETSGRVYQLEQVGSVLVVSHQNQTYRIDSAHLSDFVVTEQ